MSYWVAGSVVVGALINASSSQSAADTQSAAAAGANQAQYDFYNQNRRDTEPWRQAGSNALSQIGAMNGQFTHAFNADDLKSNLAPNYDFQLQQGLGATQNLANASGGLLSGNTLKGINDYAQNFAGNAYQQAFNNYNAQQTNIFNRLSNIAGLGQTANQTIGSAGQQFGTNIGNNMTSAGAAQAAGQVGSANAINNGIGNYLGWSYLNSRQTPAPSSYWGQSTAPGGGQTYVTDSVGP